MTEYSFYKGIRYRNTKPDKAYVATGNLSVRMPIVLPMQK